MDDTLQVTTYIIDGKHRSELMLIPKTTTEERTATVITVANIALKHEIPMAIFSLPAFWHMCLQIRQNLM